MPDVNQKMLLITGSATSGKYYSLRNIRNKEKWIYLCTENKPLPFSSKIGTGGDFLIKNYTGSPEKVVPLLFAIGSKQGSISSSDGSLNLDFKDCEGVILDSITLWGEDWRSKFITNAPKGTNTMKMWGTYADTVQALIKACAMMNIPVIILAHSTEITDDITGEKYTKVVMKGSTDTNGLEAYFTTVMGATVMTLEGEQELPNNPWFTVTDREKKKKKKHVFQTEASASQPKSKLRCPDFMFEDELYIDNDAQLVMDKIIEYFGL